MGAVVIFLALVLILGGLLSALANVFGFWPVMFVLIGAAVLGVMNLLDENR